MKGSVNSRNWRDYANCKAVDPDLMYPTGTGLRLREATAEAKAVCVGCAAISNCLSFALGHGIYDGVWGGMSEDERRALNNRGNRRRPAA